MTRTWLIGTVLLLSGCATGSQTMSPDAQYPTYQEFLAVSYEHAIDQGPSASAPGPVKLAYGECASKFVMQQATADQRATLDSFARGESSMSQDQWKAMAGDIAVRAGSLSYSDMDRLAALCPGDVPAFKRYFRPGFNGL